MKLFAFGAFTNCVAGRDAEFMEWYEQVHVPEVLALEGFVDATTFRVDPISADAASHQYLVLYSVLASSAAEASERLFGAGLAMTPVMRTGSVGIFYEQIATSKASE